MLCGHRLWKTLLARCTPCICQIFLFLKRLVCCAGCGKTLLAQPAAAQCGANFIAVHGPELLDKVRST